MRDPKVNFDPDTPLPGSSTGPYPASLSDLPVAIAHDWLLAMRGGEWLLDALLRALPAAQVHTLIYRPERTALSLPAARVHTSPLDRLPGVIRYYRWLLPLMPWAVGRLQAAPETRLVLKISHCVAHGMPVPTGAMSVHYYLSPMRYLYDQADAYAAGGGGLSSRLLCAASPALRRWDRAAADRADAIWAISRFVADRVERVYGRPAEVIYPPVRTHIFTPAHGPHSSITNHYSSFPEALLVSALVPYKRVDLAIAAANRLGRPLRIVGTGPLRAELERMAGPTVVFEGFASEARLIELYRTRSLLIFPGTEDFGIVPLEAMACGMPVLALRAGGLLETMPEGTCGEFFDEPTVGSLCDQWDAIEPGKYAVEALAQNAAQFSEERFVREVLTRIAALCPGTN